jgi:TATA-binding protein-associated factor Taf7
MFCILAEQAEQLVLNTTMGRGSEETTSCYASNEDDDDDDDNDDDNNEDDNDDDDVTTKEEMRRDPLSNLSSQKQRRKLEYLNFQQVTQTRLGKYEIGTRLL